MTVSTLNSDVELVCEAITSFQSKHEKRMIVGIAGPPASGKSTLSEAVINKINHSCSTSFPTAALLPMDGYHLDNGILAEKKLLDIKGAPHTYNADKFCEDVNNLPFIKKEVFYPKFDRVLDLAIANSISINPKTPVVIVEGNYLLLDQHPWQTLSNLFDVTVFVAPRHDTLRKRLIDRWRNLGFDEETSVRKVEGNDLPNADLVLQKSRPSDITLSQIVL